MPKNIYSDPRVLLVSWRPPRGDAYSNVGRWLDRFRLRMALACGNISLIDSQGKAENTADLRPETWTDFIAVWTADYGLTCKEEGAAGLDRHELHRFLLHIEEGLKHGWVAKLELAFDREARTGTVKPWKCGRWHELPEQSDTIFPTASNKKESLDKLLTAAIERIRNPHPVDGPGSGEDGSGAPPSDLPQPAAGRDH